MTNEGSCFCKIAWEPARCLWFSTLDISLVNGEELKEAKSFHLFSVEILCMSSQALNKYMLIMRTLCLLF